MKDLFSLHISADYNALDSHYDFAVYSSRSPKVAKIGDLNIEECRKLIILLRKMNAWVNCCVQKCLEQEQIEKETLLKEIDKLTNC